MRKGLKGGAYALSLLTAAGALLGPIALLRADTKCIGVACGGGGGAGDVVSTGNNLFTGTNEFDGTTNFDGAVDFDGATDFSAANVLSGNTTFGTALDAAGSITFNRTTGCIEIEGSSADANEVFFCVDNPNADRTWQFPNLVASSITPLSANVTQTVTAAHIFQTNTFSYGGVEAVTTTKTAGVAEGNETYTNTGDTDGATITLMNDPTVGISWNFAVTVAQTMTIVPSAGETLYLGADQCVVSITSNTIGSTLTVRAVVGSSGGVFMTWGASGVWVCNDI